MCISGVRLQETETALAIFSREAWTGEKQVFVFWEGWRGREQAASSLPPLSTSETRKLVLEVPNDCEDVMCLWKFENQEVPASPNLSLVCVC